MPSRRSESVAFTVVVALVAAGSALPIAAVLALSGEPTTLVVASVLACVPVLPLVAAFLWLDRYEPEPRSLLALGLAWGAFVATLAALLIQGVGGFVAGVSDEAALALLAPVSEEATKGIFLVLLLVWRRNELDGILDGIVYAGMVGIGFAFTENILYLAAAYDGTAGESPGGLEELGFTFVLRCLMSPFAHPFFTAFIGIGVGLAIASRSTVVKVTAPVSGYLVAVLLHALWNGSTLFADGLGFLAVYFLLMAPLFALVVGFAVWTRTRERTLLTLALTDAARRGLLPSADIPHLVDLRSRRLARQFARRHGGVTGAAHMQDYQQAAIELGYLHHRVLRGTAPPRHLERGQHYVDRMHATRRKITFPVTPAGGAHR